MRKSVLVVLGLLVFTATAEARSRPTPYLSVTESKLAVEQMLRTQTLTVFADRRPTIRVRCWKVSREASRCRARFTADRLSGRVRVRVREYVKQDDSHWLAVRMGGLRID